MGQDSRFKNTKKGNQENSYHHTKQRLGLKEEKFLEIEKMEQMKVPGNGTRTPWKGTKIPGNRKKNVWKWNKNYRTEAEQEFLEMEPEGLEKGYEFP